MKIVTKELTPELWPALETLFGHNGACGGCWCQAWRIAKGERWDNLKGDIAKERFREGVRTKTTLGVLAFAGDKPVGWCNFGPRLTYPRLERARTLKCSDADQVWSVTCFYVARGCREQGVATALLDHALRLMKKLKVEIVEAYPSKPDKDGRYIAAFSWTGTQSLFEKAGFQVVGNQEGSKQRVRKKLAATS
jgi:ribosomal protein S18 acetylase RimI-like enzyme